MAIVLFLMFLLTLLQVHFLKRIDQRLESLAIVVDGLRKLQETQGK